MTGVEPQRGRNIALCCSNWSDPSTVHAWTWLKQYMLRRAGPVGQGLDPQPGDHLFIVHVGKGGEREQWKMGGPLIPDLETCLESYPYEIEDLAGSIQGNIREFLERASIDIVVFGNKYPMTMLKALSLLTVREWIQQHVSIPYVFIRPEAVRNVRMRLCHTPEPSPSSMAGPMPGSPPPRRIAISYPSLSVGRALIQVARDRVLELSDTVDMVHVYPESGDFNNPMREVVRGTMKLVRAMTHQRSGGDLFLSEADTINFGAAELEGYKVNLNVVLRGDPKAQLQAYVERERVDLLIIGSHSANAYQTKFQGGTTSGYLMEHVGCPVMVVPHAALTAEDGEDGSEPLSPSASSPKLQFDASRTPQLSFQAQQKAVGNIVMVLQQQLQEKDRIIADLKAQLAALQIQKTEQ